MPIVLEPGRLQLTELRRLARQTDVEVAVDPTSRDAVDHGADFVADIVARGETVYGVNTGFGLLARKSIPRDKLDELQRNLVLSHCCGTGPLLPDSTVRLTLGLKLCSLARGYSGVRWSIIETLQRLVNEGVYPCIPSQGSVGASGDLAPLAHMTAALLGIGEVRVGGETTRASTGLKLAGVEPIELGPKEGLALLNGTQVSTALALEGLFAAEDVLVAAIVSGAMSVEAVLGSHKTFDPRIHALRGTPEDAQSRVASALLRLVDDSEIERSHEGCDRVQDPYSIRCQPQVIGACLEHLEFAAEVFRREANSVSDNPLVFTVEGDVLSGGNFHAQAVAMAADTLAIAIAEIGALSERRTALLMDSSLSGLPPFLAKESGLHSGFMIAQVTAAALASENKSLAHPASVDSLPTSANQEDHVSMATYAARRLGDMCGNAAGIVGIELLAAGHGIELRRPLRTSERLEAILAELRERVPLQDGDHFLAPDLAAARAWVESGGFRRAVNLALPSGRE